MKIAGFETFTVKVPSKVYVCCCRENEVPSVDEVHGAPQVILKLRSEDGLVGLGEVRRFVSENDVKKGVKPILRKNLSEINLQDLNIDLKIKPAVEMALLDLIGKTFKVPVYRLFGGAFRRKIPLSYCIPIKKAKEAAKEALEAVNKGYKLIKVKAWEPSEDIKRVKAIVEAIGDDFPIRVDANEGWRRLSTARKMAEKFKRYNIESFEDPIPKWNLDQYTTLRKLIDIPIMLHLSSVKEVVNAVKREACDYLNLPARYMGLFEFRRAAAVAEAADIPIECGVGIDLAIAEAAALHLCAATANATLPSDLIGNYIREDDLAEAPLPIRDGFMEVPEKPGLGVELDEEALQKYLIK
ncbi:mandelate racemase/muconate lactonizing enzyme family protein [Candidatus Bathyarchaeota archaeon]|nr:mandelate racemase/muconate lactonizing enzyme family protein [Candidatus Bathyarchaeota archaeon]